VHVLGSLEFEADGVGHIRLEVSDAHLASTFRKLNLKPKRTRDFRIGVKSTDQAALNIL